MKLLHLSLLLLCLSLPQQVLSRHTSDHHSKCSTLPEDSGSTLKVFHSSSPCSPLKPKTNGPSEVSVVQTQLQQDRARVMYLSSLVLAGKSDSQVAWGRQLIQTPTYLVRVQVGTPPHSFLMAVDTSNDAAWLPCNGCLGCPAGVGSSLFAYDNSSSFGTVACATAQCSKVTTPICSQNHCTFNQTYGSSTISASLSQDTITLAQDTIPGYLFGCIQAATGSSVPPQGLLGLGRGPLSLLSQTQTLYKSTFSYCLPSSKSSNFSGSLRLGPVAQPQRMFYTPLLTNPKRPSLYYVNLVGIKVGSVTVNIPQDALAFNPSTGAGTVIDSGTVYTRLVEPAYTAVRDEFRRRMGKAAVSSLGGFDTCYSAPVRVPSITLMFQGLNLTLPQDNFLLRSTSSNLACLAMAAAPSNVNSVLNVIASMQQQNFRVFFDVPNSRLGIAREPCT